MSKWHLNGNQPFLREISKEPPIISYKKGKSLRDILVRAKQEVTITRRPSPLHEPLSRVWSVNTLLYWQFFRVHDVPCGCSVRGVVNYMHACEIVPHRDWQPRLLQAYLKF